MRRILRTRIRPCTGVESLRPQLCYGQWEHNGSVVAAEGPTLVLCDGIRFQRMTLLEDRAQFFELDCNCRHQASMRASINVTQFHFVHGPACNVFMITTAGELVWSRWSETSALLRKGVAGCMASGDVLTERCRLPDKDICEHDSFFVCAAAHNLEKGLLCAVADSGGVFLLDSGAMLLATTQVSSVASVQCAAALPYQWAILSCDGMRCASTLQFIGLQTLEMLTVVDLGQIQVSHIASWGQALGRNTGYPTGTNALLVVATAPLAVASLYLEDLQASVEDGFRWCPLLGHFPNADVVCAATLATAPAPLAALGFSDGSVCVLRGSTNTQQAGRHLDLDVCGKHRLAVGGTSPVVACGFAVWSQSHDSDSHALFAAAASGGYRLWIKGGAAHVPAHATKGAVVHQGPYEHSPPRVSSNNVSVGLPLSSQDDSAQPTSQMHYFPMNVDASARHEDLTPWGPSSRPCSSLPNHLNPPLAPPLPHPALGGTAHIASTAEASPPGLELDAVIKRTVQEIALLEAEQNKLLDSDAVLVDEQKEVVTTPESASLIALDVPDAPRIARVSRENQADHKYARAQRELVDPIEITRAYLDRTCRPQRKVQEPYWVPFDPDASRIARDPYECSIASLSFDPLEFQVKSLCRPW